MWHNNGSRDDPEEDARRDGQVSDGQLFFELDGMCDTRCDLLPPDSSPLPEMMDDRPADIAKPSAPVGSSWSTTRRTADRSHSVRTPRAFPVKTGSPEMLYLFVFTQFRMQNRFPILLELL
jgi:hypothetical protein